MSHGGREEVAEADTALEEFTALSDFTGSGSDQLSFRRGDRLLVHAKPSAEWWWAELEGDIGYAPATYLRPSTEQDDEEEDRDASLEDPWQDEEYFGSYGTLRLHLEMLSDKSRTEAYRQVVVSNSASLRNKVVMDLGCGTGIISLFCAQLAQPTVVYAVEASSMAEYTRRLVKQNGCEAVITVLQGRAEDVDIPQQVDVLVSEWMGNCLLFEFMVESVLLARDRWLREGGAMWPSSAALTLVPCQADSYYAEKMAFWERPYGLDFTPLQPLAQQEFFTKPKFSHLIEPRDCLAVPCDVICLDMYTLQVQDLEEIEGQFHFCVEKSGIFHGFTAWFTVNFESLQTGGATVELNTGPNAEDDSGDAGCPKLDSKERTGTVLPMVHLKKSAMSQKRPTHWKQTLFMLDRPVTVYVGDSVSGTIVLRRNPVWRRHMTVTLHWNINKSTAETDNCKVGTKIFPMWR